MSRSPSLLRRHLVALWVIACLMAMSTATMSQSSVATRANGGLELAFNTTLPASSSLDELVGAQWTNDIPGQSLGYLADGAWYRVIPEETTSSEERLLVINAPYLDSVKISLVRVGAGSRTVVSRITLGDRYPFVERLIEHPALLVPLPAGEAIDEIYAFVENSGPVSLPVAISTPTELLLQDRSTSALRAMAVGALLFAMCLNGFLFSSSRRSEYIWYLGAIAFALPVQFVISGVSQQFLWPDAPVMKSLFPVYLTAMAGGFLPPVSAETALQPAKLWRRRRPTRWLSS